MIADIAAGHISIKYGFRGPNFATVSAWFLLNQILDINNLVGCFLILIGVLSSFYPAIVSYKMDISSTLKKQI